MLILQKAQSECRGGHGCRTSARAEPDVNEVAQKIPQGISQRRLLELAQRLAKVQVLGGEYARVVLSPELAQRVRQMTD